MVLQRRPPHATHPANAQLHVETAPPPEPERSRPTSATTLSLVLIWSAREPQRVGHSAVCDVDRVHLLGRAPQVSGGEAPLTFAASRPDEAGGVEATSNAVLGESLSRRQLEIRVDGDVLLVRNVGKCPMWVNSVIHSRAEVCHGDVIHLQQQISLLCVKKSRSYPSQCGYPYERLTSFGFADADGMVGESDAMWRLRQQIAQCGPSDGHVLIVGESGVGKELVAQALHQLSHIKRQVFVAENISTIPPNLGTALLFGNRRNFPNPGMEERAGLIGRAEGGTLFLDEIGDMNEEVQPLLLRVMERGGEYMRLGEDAQPRRTHVRFIAATNHPERLRPELRRRFHHEIHVPDLNERREDIPLLIRHILLLRARQRPALSAYLQDGQPRIDPQLLEQLVRHAYSTHISELAFLVEQAAADCEGLTLLPLSQDVLRRRSAAALGAARTTGGAPPSGAPEQPPASSSFLPTAEEAQRALDLASGFVARAAVRLGISRHQLNRLIRRHQLTISRGAGSGSDGARCSDDD